MKALVTGGAGFIGSHVAERLLAEGWKVIVLDDFSSGLEGNVPRGAELVCGSANDDSLLAKHLPGCAAVFHLAAVSSVIDSLERPREVHDINLTTALSLLEAAVRHKVPRFVFSSSAAVYGDAGPGAIGEDAPKNPLSHYAVQKLASEHYCGVYHRLHGIEAVCLRYFNVYGPEGEEHKGSQASPYAQFKRQAETTGEIRVFEGSDRFLRDFVPVSKIVETHLKFLDVKESGVWNVGTGQPRSFMSVAKEFNVPISTIPMPDILKDSYQKYTCADMTKYNNTLNKL